MDRGAWLGNAVSYDRYSIWGQLAFTEDVFKVCHF